MPGGVEKGANAKYFLFERQLKALKPMLSLMLTSLSSLLSSPLFPCWVLGDIVRSSNARPWNAY
jgi:hypothetical protein